SAQAPPTVRTPLPYVSRARSPHRPDLGEWVAGPGFEPGKTVIGDFTDPARYCPDLGERHSDAPFRHVLGMIMLTNLPNGSMDLADLAPVDCGAGQTGICLWSLRLGLGPRPSSPRLNAGYLGRS